MGLPQFKWRFMDLRIVRYVESTTTPGQVGYIVCEYKRGTLRVRVSFMSNNSRTNEWNFGHPPISVDENIIITVRYGRGVPQFVNFRPDLNEPSKEAL